MTKYSQIDKLLSGIHDDWISRNEKMRKERAKELEQQPLAPLASVPNAQDQTGIFDFLGGSAKNTFQGFNPFDDVAMGQAFQNQMDLISNPSNSLDQLNRTSNRFLNSASLGGLNLADSKLNDRDYEYLQNKEGLDVSDIGSFLGYLGPGALGASALRGTKLGANLTQGMSKGAKFGQRAKEGAILGGGLTGIEEGMNALAGDGFDVGNVALNTALGAVADPLLGMGIDKLFKPKNVTMNGESMGDFLANLDQMGDYADTSSTARNFNPDAEIFGPGQKFNPTMLNGPTADLPSTDIRPKYNPNQIENNPLGLNAPLTKPKPQPGQSPILGLDDGSIPKMESTPYGDIPLTETKGNGLSRSHWEKKLNDFAAQVQGVQLPPGREKETLDELWTHFAEPNDPKLDDVIELATPSLEEMNRYTPQQGDPTQFKRSTFDGGYTTEPTVDGIKVNTRPKVSDPEDFLNFQTKTDRPFSSTRVDGEYKTEVTNDGVRVTSKEKSKPKQEEPTIEEILEDLVFKKTVVKGQNDNPNFTSSQAPEDIFDFLGGEPKGKGQTRSNPGEPLGFMAGSKKDTNRPIADPDNLKSKIEDGSVSLKQTIQRMKEEFISDLQPIKDLEQKLKGKKFQDISANESITKQLRAVRRAQSMAVDYAEKNIKPILHNLKKNKIRREDFEDYMLAKHAADIIQTNPDYELPKEATPEWVDSVLVKWDNNPVMRKAQQEMLDVNNEMLDVLQKAGVYSSEDIARMKEMHPNYIPMKRDIEELEKSFGLGGNITKTKKAPGRKDGSEDKILNPIDSTIQNVYLSMMNAQRNKAMSKLEDLSNLAQETDTVLRKVNPNESTENMNTVHYFENGKKQVYEVDPSIARMVRNLDIKNTNAFVKGLEGANRLVRMGTTHYNLGFILSSMFRDPQSAIVTSRSDMTPLDLALGFLDSALGKNLEKLTGGKIKSYKDYYKEQGGLYTGLISSDFQKLNKMSNQMLRSDGIRYINPLNFIGKIGEVAEHTQKLAEFRQAKKKGKSDEDAMFEAVDIMDYSDAGNSSREINRVVTYFNAAMRGNARLAQAFKENPVKTTSKAFALITVPTILNELHNQSDNISEKQRMKLDALQDWERNIFWHVAIPGSDTVLALPKAPVLGQAFANPVQHTFDYLKKRDPKAYEGMTKNLTKSLAPPSGIPLYQQFFEVWANKDFFLEAPIVSNEMSKLPKNQQYDEKTSELAKFITSKYDGSPMKADHIIKGLTGGLGQQTLGLSDRALASGGAVDRALPASQSDSGALNPANIVSKRFTTDELRSSGQSNEVYEMYGKLYEAKESKRAQIKEYIRQKNPNASNEQITDFMRGKNFFEHDKQLSLAEQMKDEFSKINRNIKNIRMNKEMSSDEKRNKIMELREKEQKLNKYFLEKGYVDKVAEVVSNLE